LGEKKRKKTNNFLILKNILKNKNKNKNKNIKNIKFFKIKLKKNNQL
jgi:hypothetical protein